jgi:HEAT repeat protein
MLDARAPRIRQHAVAMLGYLGYKAAANKLTEMLVEDPSTSVRSAAAEALGHMQAEEAASTALVVLLRKGDLLGSNVCWALGEMKSQKAVSALIQIVDKELPAMIALGKIGNELAIKPLVRVLESSSNLKARICAARALGYFNTNDALQALKKARRDDPSPAVKREMLFAIFKMEPGPNKNAVLRYVADWDLKVRLTATALLLSKGFLENISVPDMVQDIEDLPADQRVWFWTTLKESFEDIPDYSPHGLGYRRDAQIAAITKWFNKNKLDFYWDKAAGKFKLK